MLFPHFPEVLHPFIFPTSCQQFSSTKRSLVDTRFCVICKSSFICFRDTICKWGFYLLFCYMSIKIKVCQQCVNVKWIFDQTNLPSHFTFTHFNVLPLSHKKPYRISPFSYMEYKAVYIICMDSHTIFYKRWFFLERVLSATSRSRVCND